MPTGLTADIENGMTFEKFAWGCARQFGALIEMRDSPHDEPIPKKLKVSSYHKEELTKARKERTRLLIISTVKCEEEAIKWYNKEFKQITSYVQNRAELREKYEAMLEQVEEFVAPSTKHIKYKEFMRSQLIQSIDFDCNLDYYKEQLQNLKHLSGGQWLEMKLDGVDWNIKYHIKEYAKEVARTKERNEWISALRKALR